MTRYLCRECGWWGSETRLLRARNPFDSLEIIHGCPACRQPETMVRACDEPDCRKPVEVGTPTPEGYRSTCSEHAP